jgi:hypothetical protein
MLLREQRMSEVLKYLGAFFAAKAARNRALRGSALTRSGPDACASWLNPFNPLRTNRPHNRFDR